MVYAYSTIIFNSLGYLTILSFLLIATIFKNEYVLGMVRYITNNLLLDTKSTFIKAYSFTWFTFLVYNMYSSIFHLPHFFMLENNNVFFTILFILSHILIMCIFAIYEVGITNILKSLYVNEKGILNKIMNIMIMVINLMTNFLIKPFSLILRIVINIFIGDKFHEVFEVFAYGDLILEFLSLIKFTMYIIQIYIIMLLSNKIYTYLTTSDHSK